MNIFALFKSFLSSLVFAVGQVFAWLNGREARKEDDETKARIATNMQAAAKPDAKNAATLNRWLARGRSGRLRNRRR
ncbi:MAG: hypothetical protein IH899_18585 [Planctomycetes bacterium]|nr:hypothetical protein [Planctomycetota bacterium]